MIDLQEDRSLVRNLLEAGLDVYVLDWGNPTRADQFINLDDMIDGQLRECVEYLVDASGGPNHHVRHLRRRHIRPPAWPPLEPQLFRGAYR